MEVTLAQDVLEKLICCCPVLERLSLNNCDGFSQLKIEETDAPNLQFLEVRGSFEDFTVVNTSSLIDVSIAFCHTLVPSSSSRLIRFFDGLPCIQRLQLHWDLLKYMAAGALLEKLPIPCLHLKFLYINLWFYDREDILISLCLLRCCPAVETLQILRNLDRNTAKVSSVNSCLDVDRSYSLPQLRHVTIYNFPGLESELDFIQFLLLSSPVLESVTVSSPVLESVTVKCRYDPDVSLELVKKLLRLKRRCFWECGDNLFRQVIHQCNLLCFHKSVSGPNLYRENLP